MMSTPTVERNNIKLKVEYLTLDEIRRDGGIQPRVAMNLQHVKLLEEQLEEGQQLDPVTVFYDGELYWLADGFHRWQAHRNCCQEVIACNIYRGSRRDAVLYSVGANADHKSALPRTRVDKHLAILRLLEDQEWKNWSDREIGHRCKVDHKSVGKMRQNLTGEFPSEKQMRTYKTKHGTVALMNTTNIGKKTANQQDASKVKVKADQPLLSRQSGTIARSANLDAAMMKLDIGTGELDTLVERLSRAHQLQLTEGGLVEIHCPNNSKINGRLGRIACVNSSTVEVWLRDINTMTMYRHSLKHQQVEPKSLDEEPQLVEVCLRIIQLRKYNLDPFEVQILALLEQPVAFTPVELDYLTHIEQRYGLIKTSSMSG